MLLRFIIWDNNDPITHEVMGGLKNVYAIDVVKFSFDVLSFD
jgi:glycerol-3-phosphate dehydrogenase